MRYQRTSIFVIFIIILSYYTSGLGAYDVKKNYSDDNFIDVLDIKDCDLSKHFIKLYNQYKLNSGTFFTISTSGSSEAFHLQLPIILRTFRPTGVCLIAIVIYSSNDAKTTIVDRSGTVIKDVQGPHRVFVHGLGLIGFNGSLVNSPLWFTMVSFLQPRIF
jgi:hypothetical protein